MELLEGYRRGDVDAVRDVAESYGFYDALLERMEKRRGPVF